MLNSCRTGLYALAAAACLVGGVASAQTTTAASTDHDVIIIDGAYFPALIYAQVGDRLIFENASNGVHIIEGPAESWTSGPIPIDGTFTLLLEETTPLVFSASADTEGDSVNEGDVAIEQIGEIRYDAAPVNGN
jgi:plastocyanin